MDRKHVDLMYFVHLLVHTCFFTMWLCEIHEAYMNVIQKSFRFIITFSLVPDFYSPHSNSNFHDILCRCDEPPFILLQCPLLIQVCVNKYVKRRNIGSQCNTTTPVTRYYLLSLTATQAHLHPAPCLMYSY